MRVHNSSLTFSPIGLNQKPGRNNSAKNNEASTAQDAPKINQPSSTDTIKNALDTTNLAINFTHNIIKPTDSRTLRALSAYNQQVNAPLQDQRAQLISGIDIYA